MNREMFLNRFTVFVSVLIVGSSSYHQQNSNRRSTRYPDREKDRLDRLERERERIHARERDMAIGYNLNEDELISDRHFGARDEYQMHRDERRAAIDRDPRIRDPRVDRTSHLDVGSNSRHLVNSSNYDDNVDLIREKEKERFAHRRDRDAEYSPHRGNRRVLNANAM